MGRTDVIFDAVTAFMATAGQGAQFKGAFTTMKKSVTVNNNGTMTETPEAKGGIPIRVVTKWNAGGAEKFQKYIASTIANADERSSPKPQSQRRKQTRPRFQPRYPKRSRTGIRGRTHANKTSRSWSTVGSGRKRYGNTTNK